MSLAINVYIDGYNFYYSISKRGDRELLPLGWCNFGTLADRLVNKAFPGARVGAVKYYTARVPKGLDLRSGEIQRQQLWLDALKFGTKDRVRIIAGYYARDNVKSRVEKETDVSLAIAMVRDALLQPTDDCHDDPPGADEFASCGGAVLISADRDFLPAAKMVGSYGKKVAIFRPLGSSPFDRRSDNNVVYFDITEEDLHRSRLPDRIERPGGSAITWRRYRELKDASMQVSPSVPARDPAFDRQCQAACRLEAAQSIDRETQVGCVVVDKEQNIIVKGHNTLPRGVTAAPLERLERPEKYKWVEHAERNAIYDAARYGISLEGCTMYVDLAPCVDCARGIVQAGICQVVISSERMRGYSSSTYHEQQQITQQLFREAALVLRSA